MLSLLMEEASLSGASFLVMERQRSTIPETTRFFLRAQGSGSLRVPLEEGENPQTSFPKPHISLAISGWYVYP